MALLEDFLLFSVGGEATAQKKKNKTTNYGARGGAAVEWLLRDRFIFRTRVVFKFIIFKKYFIYYDWRWSSPQVFFLKIVGRVSALVMIA